MTETPNKTETPEATETPAENAAAPEAPRQRTPEELRAQKRRNVAIALSLAAFMVLVFVVTVVRLQQNTAGLPQ